MEHHRLRKYRGPETWARVRQAYIAGESAPSLVRPIRGGADDPETGLTALVEAGETPPIDAHAALAEAVRRAAWLLSRGKTADATALLRAATVLDKLKFRADYRNGR